VPKPAITETPHVALALERQAQTDPVLRAQIDHTNDVRWAAAEDMRKLRMLQPTLPELPESKALEVYDLVRETEARLVAPHMRAEDYGRGTAAHENELLIVAGGRLLLSAEHATDPPRKKGSGADHGTAALAALMADFGADAIIPIGLQTTNAVSDPEHPVKHAIRQMLTPDRVGFISLHGMSPNKVDHLLGGEIHALVGLGTPPPRVATLEAVELGINRARDELGLKVKIGNYTDYLLYEDDPKWNGVDFRDKSGRLQFADELPLTNRLEAGTPNTTVNFVIGETVADANLATMPSLQLELSRSIRLSPDNLYARDRSAAAMGVYMGYLLMTTFVRSVYESA